MADDSKWLQAHSDPGPVCNLPLPCAARLSKCTFWLTQIIALDQIDTSIQLFDYGKFLTLWISYVCLYMTYPLKEFIRNKIGSLYSFLFALSFLTLFFIWPLYSLMEEFITNQTLTFNFITQNKALIITFIVIIVFSFHLLAHSTFFEGNLPKTRKILQQEFTKGTLTRALE